MRQALLSLAFGLCVASCATTTVDIPLAGLDLNDSATIARLQRGLSREDSGALAVFALRHWPASRAFCGEPVVDSSGRLPTTVGEAIALTKAREQADAAAALARAQPASPGERLLEERDREISQRDALLARQQVAQAKDISGQARTELEDIEQELAAVNKRLIEINRKLQSPR